MRIIAGTARGRRLKAPKGGRTRPTPDRVREAVFSILGDVFMGRTVIDLYAGTGSLGLEALSRGATGALFVEKHRGVCRILAENVRACGFEESARVITASVSGYLNTARLPADVAVVFADPPYKGEEGSLTLLALSKRAKSLQGSLVVLEHAAGKEPEGVPRNMTIRDRRTYGDTSILLLEITEHQGV